MEKRTPKTLQAKKPSLYNRNDQWSCAGSDKSEIRLGINSADEKAEKELRKRKLEEPLSIEERLFRTK